MSHSAIDATIKWLESCETESQLDTCKRCIFDTILCSDMERETLKDEYYRVQRQRQWVAAKVSLNYEEPQPTDLCTQ